VRQGINKELLENKLNMPNHIQLWDSMKSITNMQPSKKCVSTPDDLQKAIDLNNFYLRFEKSSHTPVNIALVVWSLQVFLKKSCS